MAPVRGFMVPALSPIFTRMKMMTESEIDEDACDDVHDAEDPFLGLTKNQRVVLYTLYLCLGEDGFSDDAEYEDTMGNINVMKTMNELRKKGLMDLKGDNLQRVTRSYKKNCIVNDIDKDFFLEVATPYSLLSYTDVYLNYSSQSGRLTDTSRIPYMRRTMQDHSREIVYLKGTHMFCLTELKTLL
ncbi:uncharacterized protein LOC134240905 [Saccostrea cucullata]|uniref:uncharacterized protein LOC134240905 n=1 Tax=Saccostrea cuccullata TaxID=36930 RepID=UPI002ED4F064